MINIRFFSNLGKYLKLKVDKSSKVGNFISLIEEQVKVDKKVIQKLGIYHFERKIDISRHDLELQDLESFPLFPSSEMCSLYIGFPNLLKIVDEIYQYKNEPRNYEKKNIEFSCEKLTKPEIRFVQLTSDHFFLKLKTLEGGRIMQVFTKQFEKIPKGISEVLPGFLYLGSMKDARDTELLKKKEIFRVVNISNWKGMKYDQRIFKNIHINIEDVESVKIFQYFNDVFSWIDSDTSKALVHCIVGRSRSASFVIGYLMKTKKMNLKEAYCFLKNAREIIRPNDGFFEELRKYEIFLYGDVPESLDLKKDVPEQLGGHKNRPKKKKKKITKLVDREIVDFLTSEILTEKVLENIVNTFCGGEYSNKKYRNLIEGIRKLLKDKKSLITNSLRGKSWSFVESEGLNYSRIWYSKKISEKKM